MSKTKKIDPATLYKIIMDGGHSKKPIDGYKFIERTITGSDYEDGGTEYDLIIQEVESEKYYAISYCDWDIDNTDYDDDTEEIDGRCDLPDEMDEVTPQQVTITKYV